MWPVRRDAARRRRATCWLLFGSGMTGKRERPTRINGAGSSLRPRLTLASGMSRPFRCHRRHELVTMKASFRAYLPVASGGDNRLMRDLRDDSTARTRQNLPPRQSPTSAPRTVFVGDHGLHMLGGVLPAGAGCRVIAVRGMGVAAKKHLLEALQTPKRCLIDDIFR